MRLVEHDWSDCLNFGDLGEKLAKNLIHLLTTNISQLTFSKNPSFQRQGKDLLLNICDIFSVSVEVKTREHNIIAYWHDGVDFLIETISVIEQDTPGWIFTSKADILFYGVLNERKDDWSCAWVFNLEKLQTWFKSQNQDGFQAKITHTRDKGYSTAFCIVPKEIIPQHIISEVKSLKQPKKGTSLLDESLWAGLPKLKQEQEEVS